jgi:hypothetical protein
MAVTQAGKKIIKMAAQGDELVGLYKVKYLLWYSKAGAAGDDLLVTESDGTEVWPDVIDVANNYVKQFALPDNSWLRGVKLTTLDSGYVLVYLSDK